MRHAIPKNDAAKPTFVRCLRPWKRPEHHDRRRRTKKRTDGNKKRKQNADRRGSPCFTLRRSAHPGQGALACRRSTAALPLGLAHPKVRSRTMFRGASAFGGGGLPPAFAPVTASTSHAGHSAGRLMSEPPECEGDEPSARGHRTRSRQPSSPADVLHGEREAGAFIPSAQRVKPNHRCALPLDSPTLFAASFLNEKRTCRVHANQSLDSQYATSPERGRGG